MSTITGTFDKDRLKHLVAASNDIVGRDKMRIMEAIDDYIPWIRVEDQLPEEGTRVETMCVNDAGEIRRMTNFIVNFDGLIGWGGFRKDYKPIKWRYLPKSWKE